MSRVLCRIVLMGGLLAPSLQPQGSAAPRSPRPPASFPEPETDRWARRAEAVTITRDDWGIAHVRGRTDADAVFGMVYAQAEDDFWRVERNYLVALGRLAEAEGEAAVWRDLRARLYVVPDSLQVMYRRSPRWLRTLMDAWADGLNYYLATHPQVRPRALARFEPWMALSFTEGSIGGDLEEIDLGALAAFHAPRAGAAAAPPPPARDAAGAFDAEPRGSNGIALGPSRTASGRAMLLINPHTTFFFRSELHMASDEGLDVYGAVTWGQLFVYQGFNARAGWMHSTAYGDAVDEYLEDVQETPQGLRYRYEGQWRTVRERPVTLRVRTGEGLVPRTIPTYHTHHGPVVRQQDGRWVTVRMLHAPVPSLIQSWRRTTVRGYADMRRVMDGHTNTSNNTTYADADGTIAFFGANFMPRRDTTFDWRRPVDGTTRRTEWGSPHGVEQSPFFKDPPSGYVQNTNNWPVTAAGPPGPGAPRFASYFARVGENPRGIHALRVLGDRRGFTLDDLITAAYDRDLPAFDDLLPPLVAAFDSLPPASPRRAALEAPVGLLRRWDRRWDTTSVATSLAVFWGEEMWRRTRADAESEDLSVYDFIARRTADAAKLDGLEAALARLVRDFGTWVVPWGEINRFQRLTGDLSQPFDDARPSIPVGFTSARWGSLASFGAAPGPGTRRWYGTSGNSFVAAVEFGPRVTARAVSAGGESGDPASPHFNDQAVRYAAGALRPVYFHPDEIAAHAVRTYRPGR